MPLLTSVLHSCNANCSCILGQRCAGSSLPLSASMQFHAAGNWACQNGVVWASFFTAVGAK